MKTGAGVSRLMAGNWRRRCDGGVGAGAAGQKSVEVEGSCDRRLINSKSKASGIKAQVKLFLLPARARLRGAAGGCVASGCGAGDESE